MNNFIEKNLENMKNDLKTLVSFNSVFSEDVKPFGLNNQKVLDAYLDMMKSIGLNTKNLDYYCGFGEIGQGDKTIGVVGHLDVVPVSDGWNSDPFTLTEVDNILYGRGVSDDKGAMIASLYAVKYLIESGYQFKNKLRLIAGCNEETGSKCVEYYLSKEPDFDMGFTPDGSFPGIYGEKGMTPFDVYCPSKLVNIKAGDARNIVPKIAQASVYNNELDINLFKSFLEKNNINYEINEIDNIYEIKVFGKPAHGSLPNLGINAIAYLLVGLKEANFEDEFITWFYNNINLKTHGELMGFESIADENTNTSCSASLISIEKGIVKLGVDLRFPVSRKCEDSIQLLEKTISGNVKLEVVNKIEPLYFEKTHPMISALTKAYQTVTNDFESQMMAIGGGTYAKAFKNCIAFGCEFVNEDCHIHESNECLKVESLINQVKIYVEAIKNLDNAL